MTQHVRLIPKPIPGHAVWVVDERSIGRLATSFIYRPGPSMIAAAELVEIKQADSMVGG